MQKRDVCHKIIVIIGCGMSEDDNLEQKRKDDSFMRGVVKALILTVVGQGLVFLVFVGVYINQQNHNTRAIEENRQAIKDLSGMRDLLTTIAAQVTSMNVTMIDLSKTVTSVAYEQQRRTTTIERADRFMTDHEKDHARMMERSR